MGLLLFLQRNGHMLRNVPLRQLMRRLALMARFRLPRLFPVPDMEAPPPAQATRLPAPVFAPRAMMERHAEGWRLLLPWQAIELGENPDWRRPPAGAVAGAERAILNNLHFMEFLESVDDATFERFVLDWIRHNPAAMKDAWKLAWRPYNLSLRVVVWMQQLTRREISADGRQRILQSLAQQMRFLECHLETDLRGNHLIKNLKALLWAGAFFEGTEADRWRQRGLALLESELQEQVLVDGVHYERSPAYQCQVMADLVECLAVLGPCALASRLAATLERMLQALDCLTHADGSIALFNDGASSMAYRPTEIRAALALLAGRQAPQRNGAFALEAGGYFGFKSAQELLVVDCGPIGPDYLIGHGHGDILSFEWSPRGQRMIVDQGTFAYMAGPQRRASRATSMHNTVSIDGADQCDFYGAFRCGRRAQASLLAFEPQERGVRLAGTHDGFATLEGRPRHRRTLTRTDAGLVIKDEIENRGDHTAAAGFLLHPDCRATATNGGVEITTGSMTVEVRSDAAIALEPAEWYPDLYVAVPTTRLRMTFPAGCSRITTRFSITGG